MTDELFADLSLHPEKYYHIFDEVICSNEQDFEKCKLGLETWWPLISIKIFTMETSDLLTQTICYKDTQTSKWEWDCDNCKMVVKDFFEFMNLEMGPSFVENLTGIRNFFDTFKSLDCKVC